MECFIFEAKGSGDKCQSIATTMNWKVVGKRSRRKDLDKEKGQKEEKEKRVYQR
jgi:hypothetical protein